MNKPMLTNPDVEYRNIKVNFDTKTTVTVAVCAVAICIVAVVLLGLLLFFVSANNLTTETNDLKTETNNLMIKTKLPPPGDDMMTKGMFRCLVHFILNTFFSHPANSSSDKCVVYCKGACQGLCCEAYYPYCDKTCGYCCCHW
jgi:hypothetical protein